MLPGRSGANERFRDCITSIDKRILTAIRPEQFRRGRRSPRRSSRWTELTLTLGKRAANLAPRSAELKFPGRIVKQVLERQRRASSSQLPVRA